MSNDSISELKFGKNAAKLDIRRPAKSRLSRSPAGEGDLFIRIFPHFLQKLFRHLLFFLQQLFQHLLCAKTFHFFCNNFSLFLLQVEIGLSHLLSLTK